MTDRERSLITWLVRVLDQADAELAKHNTMDGEPFAHIRQIAFEGLDRPTDAELKAYREGKFTVKKPPSPTSRGVSPHENDSNLVSN